MFKPITYGKNLIFVPQHLLNRLNSCSINVTCLRKTTKRIKNILVAVQRLTIFGIDLFLNTLNLSIPFSFIYPKISIANLVNTHSYNVYVDVLQIEMPINFLKLISKALQHFHMKFLNERISKLTPLCF